jgi:uncharacterized membrane protein YccC
LGLCVYASALLDGNRSYAAVLSGYTVAFSAIQQVDAPQHVFESGVARGAAIAVGIAAMAIINDLLVAPDSHRGVVAQLGAIHHRVRAYAKICIRDHAIDVATAAGLLREMAALRPEIASLAMESSGGSVRSAAARSTAVALVAEVHAARVLNGLPTAVDPAFCERLTWANGARLFCAQGRHRGRKGSAR